MKFSQDIFSDFPLKDLEMKVYLAALELGSASVQELSRKSGVKRTSIYNFIDALKQRGFIQETKKNKRRMYTPVHPQHLIDLEKKKTERLEDLLPQLLAIYNVSSTKPKVTFYEGKSGIEEVYFDILENRTDVIGWSDFLYMEKVMGPKFLEEYPRERVRRNISFMTIASRSVQAKKLAQRNIGHLREMKFMKSDVEFKTEINIYGNKVAVISFRNPLPFAVLIEDTNIAETLKVVWKGLWGTL